MLLEVVDVKSKLYAAADFNVFLVLGYRGVRVGSLTLLKEFTSYW